LAPGPYNAPVVILGNNPHPEYPIHGIERLTERQVEVLRWLCAGLSVAEVAKALGVKPTTVRSARGAAMTRAPQGTTVADVCREFVDRDGEGVATPTK
jgi:DNA-binding CsgD family transcriptional regulator